MDALSSTEFDLYRHIPPPLPLIADCFDYLRNSPLKIDKKVPLVSHNDPVYVLHEEVLAQQLPEPKQVPQAPRKRRKPQNETVFLQVLRQAELATDSSCTCGSTNEAFLLIQRVLSNPVVDIPLVYRDLSDALFNEPRQLQKYKFVYVRHRPTSYKSLIRGILDPTLPFYKDQDLSSSNTCPEHSDHHSRRKRMQIASQSISEFSFDSQFESGNLDKAIWVKESEFNLFLTADTNTRGHTQWFYFAVRNVHKDKTVTLNIMNLTKNGSLFNRGMRPAVFSVQRLKKHGQKWTRGGYDVRYWKNSIPRKGRNRISHFYTLTFNYTFMYDNDTVYFAYSEPYNYSKLRLFLDRQKLKVSEGVVWEETVLCKTLGGLDVPLLTIKDGSTRPKRQITVTARVHPGETVGSFMCEGFLQFITSQAEEAIRLRRSFDILVVPMLNPDGVVAGNTRTSLAGVDLNRKWKEPDDDLHPSVACAKRLSATTTAFIDLHGHSKKEFCFMYGNRIPRKDPAYWRVRFLPLIVSKLTDFFSFSHTRFFTEKWHSQSARAVLYTQYGIVHSFTLEASFHGCIAEGAKKEFLSNDYRSVGANMGVSLAGLFKYESHLFENRLSFEVINNLSFRIKDEVERKQRHARFRQRSVKQIKESKTQITTDCELVEYSLGLQEIQSENSSEEETESSGSDSEPSFDNLEEEETEVLQANIRRVVAESNVGQAKAAETSRTHDALEHIFERYSGEPVDLRQKRQIPDYLSYVERGRSILSSQHSHRIWTQRLLTSKSKIRSKLDSRTSTSPLPERHTIGSLRHNYGSFETYIATLQKRSSNSSKLPPLV